MCYLTRRHHSLPSTSKHTIGTVQTAFDVQLEQLIDDDGRVQICDLDYPEKYQTLAVLKHTEDAQSTVHWNMW